MPPPGDRGDGVAGIGHQTTCHTDHGNSGQRRTQITDGRADPAERRANLADHLTGDQRSRTSARSTTCTAACAAICSATSSTTGATACTATRSTASTAICTAIASIRGAVGSAGGHMTFGPAATAMAATEADCHDQQ